MSRRSRAFFLVALLLAACSPAADSTAGSLERRSDGQPASSVEGLSATVVQYTRDRPQRRVQVKVTNGSDQPIDLEILDPGLAGYDDAVPPDQRSHLEPGRRVDFPVNLEEPSCDATPAPTSQLTLRVSTTAGTIRQHVPIDDASLLSDLHTLDCAIRRVEANVDIALGDDWRQVRSGAHAAVIGEVSLRLRPGGSSATVSALDAGLLLSVRSGDPSDGDGAADVTVDEEYPQQTWQVELIGTRCDGHAIAESRRLIALTFLTSVPGADDVPIRRSPDVDAYETMVAALLERCAAREGGTDI
ncbi:MAG TPA: hypothetical protein VFZ70_04790 [Euzebyales bacterium]